MKITFCGHKDVSDKATVEQWLYSVCSELIDQGATEFYLGGYGNFDYLCASTLRELKKQHPTIKLILVLPYLNSSMMTEGYDETVYPPLESVPKRFAISRRNEFAQTEALLLTAITLPGCSIKTIAAATGIQANTLYKWKTTPNHLSPEKADKLLLYFKDQEPQRLDLADYILQRQ